MSEAKRWQREAQRWRDKLGAMPHYDDWANSPPGGEVGRLNDILLRVGYARNIALCERNEARARIAELEEERDLARRWAEDYHALYCDDRPHIKRGKLPWEEGDDG